MTKVREIMTESPMVATPGDSIRHIAQMLGDSDIGGVIVCDDDDQLQGMITDRDIAVQVVAAGLDPESTTAADILDGSRIFTVGADDDLKDAVSIMKDQAVRRLPVIDGHDLVGIVSQADLARHAPESLIGSMVDEISAAPDNTGRS